MLTFVRTAYKPPVSYISFSFLLLPCLEASSSPVHRTYFCLKPLLQIVLTPLFFQELALIEKSALFRVRLREAALEKFGRKPDNDSDDGTPKSWTVVDFGGFYFYSKPPRLRCSYFKLRLQVSTQMYTDLLILTL
jgi:hypothetical protein